MLNRICILLSALCAVAVVRLMTRSISSRLRTSHDRASVRSRWPMRLRAVSARLESRDSSTTLGSVICEDLRDALADAHRRPGHDHNFSGDFHPWLLVAARSEVKLRLYNLRCDHFQPRRSWRFVGSLLPLFPLDLVLLPGTPLPLHIFEPRYKEMIGECLEQKKVFGVLRVQGEGLADVGCTAEIVAVTKTYDDGQMDIVTQGRQRFELLVVNQERAFLRGEILYLPDEPQDRPPPTRPPAPSTCTSRYWHSPTQNRIFPIATTHPFPTTWPDPCLSTWISNKKCSALRSEAERMRTIIAYFENVLPSLRRAVQVRQKASGNGHAH